MSRRAYVARGRRQRNGGAADATRRRRRNSTAQLAVKLGETGSINKLDQAREQVFYAETTADLATARQAATSARERLTRLMGLWGDDLDFRLPDAAAAAAAPAAGTARDRGRSGRPIASTCRSRGSS